MYVGLHFILFLGVYSRGQWASGLVGLGRKITGGSRRFIMFTSPIFFLKIKIPYANNKKNTVSK
jgi:hypothetical protein